MPNFEPIIGSSFDSLAGQRQFWAGFNNRVDESNMARAAQAQEQQNRWLLALAQMSRQDAAHQDDMQLRSDAIARDLDNQSWGRAIQAGKDAEEKRRFELNYDLSKRDEDLKQRHWDIDVDQNKTANEMAQKKLDAVDRVAAAKVDAEGQALASNYMVAKRAYDDRTAALTTAEQQIEQLSSSKDADPSSFKQGSTLAALKASIKDLERQQKSAENQYDRLRNHADNAGFKIDEDTGDIVHSATGKKWSFKLPATATSVTPATWFPGAVHDARNPVPLDDSGNALPWAGFQAQSAPASVVPDASAVPDAQPIQIGRFIVRPR